MRLALMLILFFATLPCLAQSDKATALMEKANVLVIEKNYDSAAETYQKAANYFRRKKNKQGRSNALLKAGQTLLLAKETYKAEQIAKKILQLNSSKDSISALGYQMLGNINYLEGQLPEALKYFKKTKTLANNLLPKDSLLSTQSTRMIGATYNRLGQSELALIHTNEALSSFKSFSEIPYHEIAATYGTLGEIFSEKKQYDIAISHFERAIDFFTTSIGEQQELVSEQFFLLGKTYIQRGNYDLGLMNSQRGLTILEDLKGEEHPDRAPFLNSLGKINMVRGNYQDAFDSYYDALDLTEFHYGEKHPSLPENHINIADVLLAQGEIDSALISYKKALNLNLDLYGDLHPKVARNLNFIAMAYEKKGNHEKAFEYLNNASELLQKKYGWHHASIANVQQEIGKIFLKENKLQEALPYFQQALNSNVPNFAATKNLITNPSSKDVFENPTFLSSLALKAQTLTGLFFIEKNSQQLKYANQAYLICDSLINNIRRSHIDYQDQLIFNNTVADVYQNAVENAFLLHQNTNDEKHLDLAFYFSEKSKSNILLQSFIHDEALRFGDLPDSLEVSEDSLKANISFYKKLWLDAIQAKDSLQIAYAQKKSLEAKEDYQRFVIELEENFEAYKQRKNNNIVTSLYQIQAVLDDDTGLIDLFIGKEKLFVFGITANHIYSEEVELTSEFQQAISDFRQIVSNINSDSIQGAWKNYNQNAHYIYSILLKNILINFDQENIANLIILPDGEFSFLPFEVLIKETSNLPEPDYKQLQYLIKDYSIGYDFSGTLFVKHQQKQLLPEVIQYGGFAPSHGSGQLSLANNFSSQFIDRNAYIDLPASRMAVQQIANLLKGKAFLGQDASSENFLKYQSQFDILHLAMHGIYDIEYPLNSHLVCAKTSDEKTNQTITASEIYNMKIDALLVILGSCNSGFGKLDQSEGVMSISRAFAYAGCPSIIKGLWSLPDEETAAISTHFFQQLKKGKKKDEALRQAKLAYLNSDNSNILKERFHPFYWAGFVPVGDMKALYPVDILTTQILLMSFFTLLFLAALLAYFAWKRSE